MFRSSLVAAALMLAACTPPVAEPPVDAANAAIEIEAAVASFFEAYEAGDADSVATFFSTDARLMPPGAATVHTSATIRDHVAQGLALGRWIQSTQTEVLDVSGSNAIHLGTYSIRFEVTETTPPGLAAFEDSGRYMIHWIQEGGRWRMGQYMANRSGG